ncbi:MAG: hypothetical protein JKY46_10540 [Robiginitomaculum sp.]|nr:hypothetical protein [Robiginitomaculum sp.]
MSKQQFVKLTEFQKVTDTNGIVSYIPSDQRNQDYSRLTQNNSFGISGKQKASIDVLVPYSGPQ